MSKAAAVRRKKTLWSYWDASTPRLDEVLQRAGRLALDYQCPAAEWFLVGCAYRIDRPAPLAAEWVERLRHEPHVPAIVRAIDAINRDVRAGTAPELDLLRSVKFFEPQLWRIGTDGDSVARAIIERLSNLGCGRARGAVDNNWCSASGCNGPVMLARAKFERLRPATEIFRDSFDFNPVAVFKAANRQDPAGTYLVYRWGLLDLPGELSAHVLEDWLNPRGRRNEVAWKLIIDDSYAMAKRALRTCPDLLEDAHQAAWTKILRQKQPLTRAYFGLVAQGLKWYVADHFRSRVKERDARDTLKFKAIVRESSVIAQMIDEESRAMLHEGLDSLSPDSRAILQKRHPDRSLAQELQAKPQALPSQRRSLLNFVRSSPRLRVLKEDQNP